MVEADKGYDVASFVTDVHVLEVTPHVAQKTHPRECDRWPHHAACRLSGQ